MPYFLNLMDRHAPNGKQTVLETVEAFRKCHPCHEAEPCGERPDGIPQGKGTVYTFRVNGFTESRVLHAMACEKRCMPWISFEPPAPVKLWCAMCGRYTDHQSGACPELHPETSDT